MPGVKRGLWIAAAVVLGGCVAYFLERTLSQGPALARVVKGAIRAEFRVENMGTAGSTGPRETEVSRARQILRTYFAPGNPDEEEILQAAAGARQRAHPSGERVSNSSLDSNLFLIYPN